MMATVPHVTSGSGLRKFQTDGFLLDRVYILKLQYDVPSEHVLRQFLPFGPHGVDCHWNKGCRSSVTYVLLHRVQDQSLQLVQAVVDPRSPPLLHDGLVALHKNKC